MPDYIDNAELHRELSDYANRMRPLIEEAKKRGIAERDVPRRMQRRLAAMLDLMAKRTATKWNFARYTFKDEMVSEALLNLVRYCHKYDPDKFDNAFAYCSKIIWQTFTKFIMKENKAHAAKIRMALWSGATPSDADIDWLRDYIQKEKDRKSGVKRPRPMRERASEPVKPPEPVKPGPRRMRVPQSYDVQPQGRGRAPLSVEEREHVKRLLADTDMTCAAISKATGVGGVSIAKMEAECPERIRMRAEKKRRMEERDSMARAMREEGATLIEIARRLGVCTSTVSNIIYGRRT